MDSLTLEPKQKARLDRVARLVLNVYNTLVRMCFLEAEWVIPGPHNVEHLIPMYRKYHLDDSIIYLYSRLPYIEAADDELVFYAGSRFMDFRLEHHVARGRQALDIGDEKETLKPWMTTLSSAHSRQDIAIVYSAKDDRIWMRDNINDGSADPCLNGERDEDDEEREDSLADLEDEDEDDQDSESDEDDSDQESDSDDLYAEIDSRPAADALRNMAKRFANFKEDPAICEPPNDEWSIELTRPLYIKHGWPREDFDGEGFQIDRIRAWALVLAMETAQQPLQEVKMLQYVLEKDARESFENLKINIESANSIDEEWQARWRQEQKMAEHEQRITRLNKAEQTADRLCPGGVAMREVHVPLWELESLRCLVNRRKHALERSEQDAERLRKSEEDVAYWLKVAEIGVRNSKKDLVRAQAAYDQSKADAQRLCPGQTFTETTGWRAFEQEYPIETIEEQTNTKQEVQLLMGRYNQWLELVPEDAKATREAVRAKLQECEKHLAQLHEHIDRLTAIQQKKM